MSETSRRHRLEGLEPDNLLAFLALLGLLRSLETSQPEWRVRACWTTNEPPLRPVLVLAQPISREDIADAAAKGIERLSIEYRFPAEAAEGEAQRDLNYSPSRARSLLREAAGAQSQTRADLFAALMSDTAARDERIEATPLCLLFGQGHQHFLERLAALPGMASPPPRGRGRRAITLSPAQTIAEAVFEPWVRQDPTPSFRWDPAEDVRYALRADDPSGDKATTQHGANRLASIGLPLLTVAPVQAGERVRLRMRAARLEGREIALYWPIWREPASLAAIAALLSHPQLPQGPAALEHLGIEQVRRARRISVGKFMNITRAEPVIREPT